MVGFHRTLVAPRLPQGLLHRRMTLVLLMSLGSALASAQPAVNQTSPLGTNLTFHRDWSGEWPFVDAFRTSRPWASGERYGCWNCGPPLDLDERGWVRSLSPSVPNGGHAAKTVMFSGAVNRYPAGTYLVLYEGEGQLEYRGAAVKDVNASAPGRDVVLVDPTQGEFFLNIVATNPANYLRNIRVIMPGGVCSNDAFAACRGSAECGSGTCQLFETNYRTQIFHPTFLNNTKTYRLVRAHHWMETNSGPYGLRYEDYPQPDDAHWPAVPVEIMAELGNRLDADIWVNLPHEATNDYVRELACRVHRTLKPDRKVYIEYSNEVWNASYPYSIALHWIGARGCQEYPDLQAGCDQDANPGNGVYCEGFPGPTFYPACLTANRRYFSQRSTEIWDIFEDVFRGRDRMVRVMASQNGNTFLHRDYLSFRDAWRKTDALATAPYFGYRYGLDQTVGSWTVDQLLQDLQTSATRGVPAAFQAMDNDAGFLAANYPTVALISYEGGQHLEGVGSLANDPNMNALFDAVNRDPRMGPIYTAYLEGWRQRGGGLFTHFKNVGQWRPGRAALLEYQDQPHNTSPKYQAVMSFIDSNPCWWPGCSRAMGRAALGVDATPSATSNGNGVLEAGETVVVAPAWTNQSGGVLAVTGTASGISGPAGATYSITDSQADYGTLGNGQASSCSSATGNCYGLAVSAPATRPAQHWDALFTEALSGGSGSAWTLHLGDSFADTPRSHPFYGEIETIFHRGVTRGCNTTDYCPAAITLRGQMAAFVLRGEEGSCYEPRPCIAGSETFGDVPASSLFCPYVEELARRGVVAGCGGGNYCPQSSVLRNQMAIFLLRTLLGSTYTPPAATGLFDDVPASDFFAPWIEDLYRRGVTNGCSAQPRLYCPRSAVTRGQMAAFLQRNFGLRLYGP